MNKIPISVLIHTLNEEKNIKNCLECVKWADEIILIDMYSDDRTVEIAKNYTEKIFFFERTGYVEPAREFALEKASHEWILIVDADELIPLNLKNKLVRIMEKNNEDVIFIPRKNYLFGHLMNGANWGSLQDSLPRFFRKNFISFSDKIHNFSIKDNSRIYYIKDPEESIVHLAYVDFEHFIKKLNHYTTTEARSKYQNKENFGSLYLIIFMIYEFFSRIIRYKGYKDGYLGFSLSLSMAFYRLAAFMKFKLMKKYETIDVNNKVKEDYEDLAREIIAKYT